LFYIVLIRPLPSEVFASILLSMDANLKITWMQNAKTR
jgi:hypothetical protein